LKYKLQRSRAQYVKTYHGALFQIQVFPEVQRYTQRSVMLQ